MNLLRRLITGSLLILLVVGVLYAAPLWVFALVEHKGIRIER